MSRAARLILAIALLGTVLVGPAAQSAKAPPAIPTEDEPPMICFEDPCWGEGCENDCGCEDECGAIGEPCKNGRCDHCNYVPCGINPCDYVNCDLDPCDYVNCNPDLPCLDKQCPMSGRCIPDPAAPTEGGNLLCTRSTVCGYLAQLPVGGTVDCVERVCDLEEDLQANLVYTGDRDGDGIEDCHDPDRDGDGLSDVLEEEIGYNPGSKKSDADEIPDAFDLVPGKDRNVKIWVQIRKFKQVDWSDALSWPDPYLEDHAGISVGDADPAPGNRLAFDELKEGNHVHDPGMDADDDTYKFDNTDADYQEVAAKLPQEWSPMTYPSVDPTNPVVELEWEMPLWDHDHEDAHGDDLAGDESYPNLEDAVFVLMEFAQTGSSPGTIDATADTRVSGVEVNRTTLDFGSKADLTVRLGANPPKCALHIARQVYMIQNGGIQGGDPGTYGNHYVGAGDGFPDPLNGREFGSKQQGDCRLDQSDGGGII